MLISSIIFLTIAVFIIEILSLHFDWILSNWIYFCLFVSARESFDSEAAGV